MSFSPLIKLKVFHKMFSLASKLAVVGEFGSIVRLGSKLNSIAKLTTAAIPVVTEADEKKNTVLISNNSREYHLEFAKPADTVRILKFLEHNFFVDEPLIKSLSFNKGKVDGTIERYIRKSLNHGLSIVAVKNSPGRDILGISINEKNCVWDGTKMDKIAVESQLPQVRKLLHIWALITREPQIHMKLSQYEIFELGIISVARKMHGQGLGTQLAKRSLALARDLNYRYARMDATSDYSKKIAEKLEMSRIWEVPYKNILLDDENVPVAVPEKPHTHAYVYFMNLKNLPEEHLTD